MASDNVDDLNLEQMENELAELEKMSLSEWKNGLSSGEGDPGLIIGSNSRNSSFNDSEVSFHSDESSQLSNEDYLKVRNESKAIKEDFDRVQSIVVAPNYDVTEEEYQDFLKDASRPSAEKNNARISGPSVDRCSENAKVQDADKNLELNKLPVRNPRKKRTKNWSKLLAVIMANNRIKSKLPSPNLEEKDPTSKSKPESLPEKATGSTSHSKIQSQEKTHPSGKRRVDSIDPRKRPEQAMAKNQSNSITQTSGILMTNPSQMQASKEPVKSRIAPKSSAIALSNKGEKEQGRQQRQPSFPKSMTGPSSSRQTNAAEIRLQQRHSSSFQPKTEDRRQAQTISKRGSVSPKGASAMATSSSSKEPERAQSMSKIDSATLRQRAAEIIAKHNLDSAIQSPAPAVQNSSPIDRGRTAAMPKNEVVFNGGKDVRNLPWSEAHPAQNSGRSEGKFLSEDLTIKSSSRSLVESAFGSQRKEPH